MGNLVDIPLMPLSEAFYTLPKLKPTAKVIQFLSGDEIELCFEAEVDGLFDDDAPSTEPCRIIWAPSSLLEEDSIEDVLHLIDEEAFDEEFDHSLESEDLGLDSSQDASKGVAARVDKIREGCNEFEKQLLNAVVLPG
jgi:hypothetical protein